MFQSGQSQKLFGGFGVALFTLSGAPLLPTCRVKLNEYSSVAFGVKPALALTRQSRVPDRLRSPPSSMVEGGVKSSDRRQCSRLLKLPLTCAYQLSCFVPTMP